MALSWELDKLQHVRAPNSDPRTKQSLNKYLWNMSTLDTYVESECQHMNILETNLWKK